MAWMTPKVNWVAGDGFGFSDTNRIEGNITYLREENKTINGTTTFTDNITQTSGVISARAGANVLHTLGVSYVGGIGGNASFGYYNLTTAEERAMAQTSSGITIINAKTGADIQFKKNNAIVGRITDTAFEFGQETSIVEKLTVLDTANPQQSLLTQAYLKIGDSRDTTNSSTYLDLIGDTTYTDYGVRFIRNGGLNGTSQLVHRGGGNFEIESQDNSAAIILKGTSEWVNVDNSSMDVNVDFNPKYSYTTTTSITQGVAFTAISSWVPSVGDYLACTGTLLYLSNDYFIIGILRSDTNIISIKVVNISTNSIIDTSFFENSSSIIDNFQIKSITNTYS